MKRGVILTIVVLIIAALIVYVYVFHKPARTAASGDAVYTVSVKELTGEFEADENAANSKYLDKIIKVHGTVESVSESENDISVHLTDDGGITGVTCSFEKESVDKNEIKPGEQVTIKGICSGFLLDVVLNKCVLATDGAK